MKKKNEVKMNAVIGAYYKDLVMARQVAEQKNRHSGFRKFAVVEADIGYLVVTESQIRHLIPAEEWDGTYVEEI